MKKFVLFFAFLVLMINVKAQTTVGNQKKVGNTQLYVKDQSIEMPFNRMIKSAGKVVTYGNPELENHTLDLTTLPGERNIVIEDRYGIAILDTRNQKIISRWSFADNTEFKNAMSTYSGI